MKNFFETNVTKGIKTHILCPVTSENHDVYEIMWENIVEPDRPRMTMEKMRLECRITSQECRYIRGLEL